MTPSRLKSMASSLVGKNVVFAGLPCLNGFDGATTSTLALLFFLFSHALRDPSGQLGSLEGLHEWCCCTRFFQLVAKCLTLAERPSAIPRWDTSFQRGFYLSVSGCTTWRRGPHRLVKCPEESALFLHTCSLLKGITWKLKLPCSLRILTLKNVLAATHSYEWSRIRCRKMTAVLLHLMHLEDST